MEQLQRMNVTNTLMLVIPKHARIRMEEIHLNNYLLKEKINMSFKNGKDIRVDSKKGTKALQIRIGKHRVLFAYYEFMYKNVFKVISILDNKYKQNGNHIRNYDENMKKVKVK